MTIDVFFTSAHVDHIAVVGNVRRRFDEEKLAELAASIREHGIIEPLILRRAPERDDGRFELVAGERRLRAARMAGLEMVPARLMEISREQAAKLQLLENLQREDLDPIEEAEGLRRLLNEHGYTQEALARELGMSQPHIANRLALLRLPDEVREKVSRGAIPATAGRELLRLEKLGAKAVKDAAEEMEKRGASTREAARMIDNLIMREGKPLRRRGYPQCEFDPSPCQGCPKMTRAREYDGATRSWCLDASCWNKKQREAEAERQRRVSEQVKGQDEVDLSALNYDSYEAFYNPEFAECGACEHRKTGFRRQARDEKIVICLNPACFRKLKAARGRQKLKDHQAALEEEARAFEAAALQVVKDYDLAGVCSLPRRPLLYLAGLVLAQVNHYYDRIPAGRWGERFGLSPMGPQEGVDRGWPARLQELDKLDDAQLWTIILGWPAVAQGKTGIVRWLFEIGGEEQTAKPVRHCRVCGCTDDDCRQCVERTGAPCHWAEEDLCSACREDAEAFGEGGVAESA